MSNESVARLFVNESAELLNQSMIKIRHCLDQLNSDGVAWRPFSGGNSIGNLILHICGNLRQWTLSGIGGEPELRDRDAEFRADGPFSPGQLLQLAESTSKAASALILGLNEKQLVERRMIQGFDVTVLQAIHHTTIHFAGHTHQIILLTRLQLGEKYRFQWSPASDRGSVPI
jgi:Protein of unknown function (DUF1572)